MPIPYVSPTPYSINARWRVYFGGGYGGESTQTAIIIIFVVFFAVGWAWTALTGLLGYDDRKKTQRRFCMPDCVRDRAWPRRIWFTFILLALWPLPALMMLYASWCGREDRDAASISAGVVTYGNGARPTDATVRLDDIEQSGTSDTRPSWQEAQTHTHSSMGRATSAWD
jgi:hypothetical protein